MRLMIPVVLVLALACGGQPEVPETGPVPRPSEHAPISRPPPLPDYGSAPDAFHPWGLGEKLFIGVDNAKIRKLPNPEAKVLHEAGLGTKAVVVEVLEEPVYLIDRVHNWVKVKSGDEKESFEGYIFGSLLTPYGGRTGSETSGEDTPWAVTYSPDHKPRLRVQLEEKVHVLDLELTKGFIGGQITAESSGWGDFHLNFDVTQCTVGAKPENQPRCVSGSARFIDGVLTQYTPVDRWRFARESVPANPASCTTSTVQVKRSSYRPHLRLVLPSYMRGPSTRVDCLQVGKVSSGTFSGHDVVECASTDGGKGSPASVIVDRFLVDGSTWLRAMCSSDNAEPEILDRLADQSIKVVDRWDLRLDDTFTRFETLPVDRGSLTLVRHETQDYEEEGEAIFQHPQAGPLFSGPDNDLISPRPSGYLRYSWSPGELKFTVPPSKGMAWEAATYSCGGEITVGNTYLSDFSPGEALGTADGEPFYAVLRTDPMHRNLYEEAGNLFPPSAGPAPKEALDVLPFLAIRDPWGRWTLLTRKALRPPNMCEPIVYLYSDPPQPVELRFAEGLAIERTWPPGKQGWKGIARPDGRVEVKGQVWDHLFWDGSSLHFPRPEQGWMVRDATELARRLEEVGLQGREIDEALAAWKLPEAPWIRVGVHSRSRIDEIAPLELTPAPDTSIRVFVELEPAQSFETLKPPPLWTTPRVGYTLVEWGVVER